MNTEKYDSLIAVIAELDSEERDPAEVKAASVATGDNASQPLPKELDKPFHPDATVRGSSMSREGL